MSETQTNVNVIMGLHRTAPPAQTGSRVFTAEDWERSLAPLIQRHDEDEELRQYLLKLARADAKPKGTL